VLGLLIFLAALALRFDGDIRNLFYAAPEVARDEERAGAIWNLPKEGPFIVAAADGTDPGFEKASRINERVWRLLDGAGVPAASLAPFLPSREGQTRNREAWANLWAKRGAAVLAELDAAAAESGFAPEAFAPFRDWIEGEPLEVTPETLSSLGLGFLSAMLASRTQEHSFLYSMLPRNFNPEAALLSELQGVGAQYVSGEVFRKAMSEAVGSDIFRFCLLTVIAVVMAVFLVFRSPLRCAAVLLPMLAGLAFSLAFFRVAGIAVNMFHAVALPLVIALSVDYGIFMQAVLEGRMDGDGKKGVLLSALTTLAGFGSLLLARHPALFSLGLSVTGGIAAALAAALWLQPRLFRQGEDL
jgi:predicted exporter